MLEQIVRDYFVFFMFWELIWKALALWKSARKNELVWFICIIAINSVGLLPITYLLYDRFFREKIAVLLQKIKKK